jgi:hypothetical protein
MTFAWGGPDRDVIAVIPRWIDGFGGALLDDDDDVDVAVYRVLDENEEATGEIVGIEIIDFLEFDRWKIIPELSVQWSINDGPSQSPKTALQALQRELRTRVSLAHAS